MKVLVFSDITGQMKEIIESNNLVEIKPDLILLLGDIHKRALYAIEHFFPNVKKIGVLGNHDSQQAFNDTSIESIHQRKIEYNGYTIAGFNGVPLFTDSTKTYAQYSEQELETFLNSIGTVDIFLAHANPQWKKPDDELDLQRGFQAYSNYLLRDHPKLFLYGHTHTPLYYNIQDTTIINVFGYQVLTIK